MRLYGSEMPQDGRSAVGWATTAATGNGALERPRIARREAGRIGPRRYPEDSGRARAVSMPRGPFPFLGLAFFGYRLPDRTRSEDDSIRRKTAYPARWIRP